MKKRMIIMLIGLGILFGAIIVYKVLIAHLIKQSIEANQNPVVTVSTMKVENSEWQPRITAAGSLRAIKGVNVTTELAGLVTGIYFTPGAVVKDGTLLVQLNADAEIGQLESLKAQAKLAQITYDRDSKQFKIHAVSKQTLDTDLQNLKSLQGQVAQQAATVAKKSIRAPFTGRLGINNVNPGQYINTGDKIVTLQALDPIYVDFYLPQQQLAQVTLGQPVNIRTDTFPGKTFTGKITTIEPVIDNTTRNVEVEGTIANPDFMLTPGMFVNVSLTTGKPVSYLTLPQTAVSYNPYGDIVFIVHESKDKNGKTVLSVTQNFVEAGETRGEQVAILKGLKAGDTVVTSGQLKLKNGSRIAVNNKIAPSDKRHPTAPNEH